MFSRDDLLMFKCEVCGNLYYEYHDVVICEREHYKSQVKFLRQCYDQAEKEIEKLHDINWELEKELMERQGYQLDTDRHTWWKWPETESPWTFRINIPVGQVFND